MADSSYSPLDSNETLGDGPTVGSRGGAAHVKSSSALQEYGPRPLAYVLDYYYGLDEVVSRDCFLRLIVFWFAQALAGWSMWAASEDQKECPALLFERFVAHFSAPHLDILHFYVFHRPTNASVVAARAFASPHLV